MFRRASACAESVVLEQQDRTGGVGRSMVHPHWRRLLGDDPAVTRIHQLPILRSCPPACSQRRRPHKWERGRQQR